MKKVSIMLVIILFITAVGCTPNKYKVGVDTDDFPDEVLPIERSLITYELSEDRRRYDYILKAGTEDDLDEIVEYYKEFFEDNELTPVEEEERKSYVAEGFNEGYQFKLIIEEPSEEPEEDLYNTIVEIRLEESEEGQVDNPLPEDVGEFLGASIKVEAEDSDIEVVESAYISNEGGTVTLPSDSPLAGASVTIPIASVDREINVSLGTVEANIENAPSNMNNTLLHIDVEGYEGFSQPMEVTMKYANTPEEAEMTPVPIYINEDGQFVQLTLKDIDQEAGTFTFYTYHASFYTYYNLDDFDTYPDSQDTGFRPSKDGFKETNQGSSKFRGGECFGMAAFAKWYFINIKETLSGDGFYKEFNEPEMGVSADDPTDIITPQDIIATMAFQHTKDEAKVLRMTEYEHSYLMKNNEEGKAVYFRSNDVAAKSIVDSLYWGWPAEVGIYGPKTKPGGHSVLAYSYKKIGEKYRFYIYDPNYPGDDTQYIDFDPATKDFDLSGYSDGTLDHRLTTTGFGTFTIVNKFQKILDQAKNNFEKTITDLEITSHAYGDEVSDGTIYLSGTLDTYNQFGEQIGQYIDITNEDGDVFTQDLTGDGVNPSNFSLEVPLKNGDNFFYFTVYYVDQYGYHNQVTTDISDWFLITSTVASKAIYVTLTWGYQPDVDLYVTNPVGDTSWYSNYYTSAGGFLDIDDTTSYGPEHFTLTTDNTVYYDQGYEINLHYYQGEGPTSYSLTVIVNEGSDYETVEYYEGTIGSAEPENNAPGSGGPDWVYITTVYPVDTRSEAESD